MKTIQKKSVDILIIDSNTVRSKLTTMIRNIIIILTLLLLTSCRDYIFDDSLRPQEYCGNWTCDSTYVYGVKNNANKSNFSIMQTGVDIISSYDGRTIETYNDWNVDNSKNIPTFILFKIINEKYVPVKSYDVVQVPHLSHLALKLDSVTYYLSE